MSGHRAWGDQGELRLATRAVQRWQTAASVGCQGSQHTASPATHFQPTVLEADVRRPPGLMPSRIRLGKDAHSVPPLREGQSSKTFLPHGQER